jgi:nucleotide-binding universal stress UspA family protein
MYHRILVALDDSAPSAGSLREAIHLAVDQKASLVLLHVVDDYAILSDGVSRHDAETRLTRLRRHGAALLAKASDTAAQAGVQSKTVLRDVTPATVAQAIVEEAGRLDCDLIVMGTHGRQGMSRVAMGSEAELVARTSTVPVLLVRKEDPASAKEAA